MPGADKGAAFAFAALVDDPAMGDARAPMPAVGVPSADGGKVILSAAGHTGPELAVCIYTLSMARPQASVTRGCRHAWHVYAAFGNMRYMLIQTATIQP